MYNRYIPQGDGSWRRSPVQDGPQRPSPAPERPRRKQEEPERLPVSEPPEPCRDCSRSSCPPRREPQQAGNFLKGLLPAGLDTEDLLVVLLLLLMSGQCREDRNLPLLTLALYLFL